MAPVSHQHEGVCVEHDAVEPHNVLVLDVVHDGGLLEELGRVGLHPLFAQTLDGHLDLWGTTPAAVSGAGGETSCLIQYLLVMSIGNQKFGIPRKYQCQIGIWYFCPKFLGILSVF